MAWIKFYPLKQRRSSLTGEIIISYYGNDAEYNNTIDDRMKKNGWGRVVGALVCRGQTHLRYFRRTSNA